MAQRDGRSYNFLELGCLVVSGGVESNIGWLEQPPKEKYQISVKSWIFDDPFHKKGPVLAFLVPGMIQSSEPVSPLIK